MVPYFPKIHTYTLFTPLANREKQIMNPATEKKLVLQGTIMRRTEAVRRTGNTERMFILSLTQHQFKT